jgi:hypothetical protein
MRRAQRPLARFLARRAKGQRRKPALLIGDVPDLARALAGANWQATPPTLARDVLAARWNRAPATGGSPAFQATM